MLPDRVSNPGPLTYESGALPTALHGLAQGYRRGWHFKIFLFLAPVAILFIRAEPF